MKGHPKLVALCLLAMACSRETPNPDHAAIDSLHQSSGIAFPEGTRILDHSAADGASPAWKEWTLSSPAEIPLPIFNNGYPRMNSASLNLEQRAQAFYARLPQDATASVTEYRGHWQTSNSVYAGTLLKTGKADFLLLIEFPK